MRPHGPSSPVEAENQHSRCSRPTSERKEFSSAWPSCLAVTRKCPQGMDDGCGSRVADANGGSNKRGLSPDLVVADEQRRGRVAVPLNAAMRLDFDPRRGRPGRRRNRRRRSLALVVGDLPAGVGAGPGRVESGGLGRWPTKAALRWGAPHVWARAAAALPATWRQIPYVALRPATLAPGSLGENNEHNATKSRSRRQGERMPWTSDCKASMRS